MSTLRPRSIVSVCPGTCAAPDCHTVDTLPSSVIPAVVPRALDEAVAVCVPLCSAGSLKRLISPTDHGVEAVPVWLTRT